MVIVKADKSATVSSRLDLARRSLAIGLLGLFSALSVVPLILSDPQSNLPACCRRNGKHRCSMIEMEEPSASHSGVTAVPPRCPLFAKLAPPAYRIQHYPFTPLAFDESMVNQPSAPARAEVEHRISAMRAHHKRGPPRFPSRG